MRQISERTSHLLTQECQKALGLEEELRKELKELETDVISMRYQCSIKDRSLCDTLQPIGFQVVFTVKNVSEEV